MILRLAAAMAVLAATTAAQSPVDPGVAGPAVGTEAPAFTLTDHTGTPRSLAALLGPRGGLLVFSRSADW